MLTLFAIKPIVLLALSDAVLILAMLNSRLTHINVMYAQSWSTVPRCGTLTPLVPPGSWSRYKEERHVILWVGIGARL